MSRAARISGVAAFFLLLVAGLMTQRDDRVLTPTTFGQTPVGHAALYALLEESDLAVARSFAPPARLAPGRTIWWIEPRGRSEGAALGAGPVRPRSLAGEALAHWIEAGGTAVVWLAPDDRAGPTLAGVAVPERDPEPESEADPTRGAETTAPELRRVRIEGPLTPQPRSLELPDPIAFAPATPGEWRSIAELEAKPFALERKLGAGRLVLVADARFARNAWLDRADAAPLAIDLVRAYGVPWIDEREHGLAVPRSALRYLVASPALAFFAGLVLLMLAFAWFGAAIPVRRVQEFDPSAPTLESYVESMARFYAATRDYARVLDRYRELTARRLRRQLRLPPDAALDRIAARLGRRRGVPAEGVSLLVAGAAVGAAPDLERAVALLDQLLVEAT